MSKPIQVLVLCTGNSARSIMAEALINQLGAGRWRAASAGSKPTGRVHPLAIEQVQLGGGDASTARSKSWDEFGGPAALPMDLVITVCGNAAEESCPIWPGAPLQVHWGFPDPAAASGDLSAQRAAFAAVYAAIRPKIEALVQLPWSELDHSARRAALARIAAAHPPTLTAQS